MSSPCQECSMYLWSIGEQNRLNYYPNKVYIINLIIQGNQTTVNRWNPAISIHLHLIYGSFHLSNCSTLVIMAWKTQILTILLFTEKTSSLEITNSWKSIYYILISYICKNLFQAIYFMSLIYLLNSMLRAHFVFKFAF